jgi:hypothetical protein
LIYQHKSDESLIKLISIPTFAHTRSIVLMDLQNLESYELKFGEVLQLKKA